MKHLALLTALGCWSAASVAQDLNRIQPAPVPAVEPPPVTPNVGDAPGAAASSTLLLPELRSLIFISKPEQLTEAKAGDAAVDSSRIPLLDNQTFRNRIEPYLGEPLRQSGLKRLLATINLFYAANDKPFVSASAPAQDVTDGVLRILVVEGRVEQVKVEGNRYFSDEQYLAALGLRAGDSLRKSQLEANIAWVNRNPFRAATIVAAPGESFGGTNLIVHANERYPVRVYANADNTGSPNTGEERLGLGVNWGNAFGRGHQLNYQLTSSADFDRSIGHSASYVVPLPWHHLLTFSGAWSRINADVPVDFDSQGTSWQTAFRYEAPLQPTERGWNQSLLAGADFKRSDNNLEFGGVPVTDNTTDIVQAVLGYRMSAEDKYGRTGVAATVVYSPGSIGSRNETRYFDISRWGAESDYSYARIDLERLTKLPANFAWRLTASLQAASDNLLGSEQLALTGTYGVRGYGENDSFADGGYMIRNELLLPHVNASSLYVRLQPLVFYDYAQGANKRLLPGERDRATLSSVGLGGRMAFGQSCELRFAYGWQLHSLSGEDRGDQAHAGIVFSY
ncbi:ShlB/FhaC/HecB family hemolysin secretion/activation protein [Peristeroidobacter agariperforans]|uniref:ShlB/FhaC/HecB family hemolysin secretion/activation protein n=1 Tax=Peristeroidobacter agariperforans TaxID=268404 RepID=UPI00101BDB62|nr:ShlB/FhaC/HecB family hemolysin secretion/activation protein [Peristeroidobacter agariperforans]